MCDVCISMRTAVVHNTAQNSIVFCSDNLPSCPPGSHHCSDVHSTGGKAEKEGGKERYVSRPSRTWNL